MLKSVDLMLQHLTQIWFLASLSIIAVLLGWLFGRMLSVVSLILVIGLFLGVIAWRKHNRVLQRNIIVFVGMFCLGIFLTLMNTFGFDDWMQGSFDDLQYRLLPANTFGFQPLDIEEQERARKKFPSFQYVNAQLDEPFLVSFYNHGLIYVQNGVVTPLNDKSAIAMAITSENVIYSTEQKGRQTLTKSQLIDGVLHILWKRKVTHTSFHHWGDVFDGRIYTPGREFITLPTETSEAIGNKYGQCHKQRKDGLSDTIEVFTSETGEHIESIPILSLIARLGKQHFLSQRLMNCKSPIHLNSVQVLKKKEHIQAFPDASIGDLLVSLRNVEVILLIDGESHDIKWYVTGDEDRFLHQHSPRITDRGTLLVFDNLGGNEQNGRSRIVEIDIRTRELLGYYEASGDEYFESEIRGKIQILDDRRIAVSAQTVKSKGSELFILTCPPEGISMSCERTDVFKGAGTKHKYGNAAFLSYL